MISLYRNLSSLRSKLGLVIGIFTFLTSSILIIYTTTSAREQAIKAANETGTALAREYAGQVRAEIEQGVTAARTLAHTFASIKAAETPLTLNRDGAHAILREVLQQNKSFYGTFTSWEPNAFDQQDKLFRNADVAHDSTGRFIPYWFKEGDKLLLETTQGYDTDVYYTVPKQTKAEAIMDPLTYTVNGERISLITIVAPVLYEQKFYGLAGVDIATDWMQQMVKEAKLYGGKATITIVSHDGSIAASTLNDTLVGKNLAKVFPQYTAQLAALKSGDEEVQLTDTFLKVYTPVHIGNSKTPWQISIEIPSDLILAEANQQMWEMILISALLLIVSLSVLVIMIRKLTKPLATIVHVTKQVAEGDLSAREISTGKDEIGQMGVAFQTLMKGLRQTTEFANQIGKGNLDAEFTALSEKDILGKALLAMRDSLKKVSEEDKKRNWTTEGLAKFGDLLRVNNNDFKALTDSIMSNLVKYVGANQGGMYVLTLDQENPELELTATYAWGRKRFREKRVALGEGLLGQTALEKEYVYINDVPQDYVNITSGLGGANPRAILIMPLKVNDEVVGIIELASFNEFEQHQIDFVEKIGENIALTLSTVKINQATLRLLEEAGQVTEEKRVAEEELLQNQEELQATQEEMLRTINELKRDKQSLIVALNATQQRKETQKLQERPAASTVRVKELGIK